MTGERTKPVLALLRRAFHSAVVWSWVYNLLRLASGLLLLPLVLRLLPKPELGMYYVFLSLANLALILDFGFAGTTGRFVSYAMGGATRLASHGVVSEGRTTGPDYPLLYDLLHTSLVFFRFAALMALLLLGTVGTWLVWQRVGETAAPGFTWLAWAVNVVAAAGEVYASVWNLFLRSMNQVVAAARIMALAYGLRLALACGLLLWGWGLMALPAASAIVCVLMLQLSRRLCRSLLPPGPPPARGTWRRYLGILWPNSWRLGLVLTGHYAAGNATVLICSSVFGLAVNATFGLSLQVMNLIQSMAAVWTLVKWPLIGQYIARQAFGPLRQVFWARLWCQLLSYVGMGVVAISFGPVLLKWIGTDKQMLATGWLCLLAFNGLLESHCIVWNTLIAAGNRLPMMKASLVTNAAALGLGLILIHMTDIGPGGLILGPLLAGLVFNYWYWPQYGARTLQRDWFQFMFQRPQATP